MTIIENNKIVKQIIKDLNSDNDNIINIALDKTRVKGTTEVLIPMFKLFEKTKNNEIKKKIKDLLSDIKDPYALEIIIEQLNKGTNNLNETLLFALWNSNLNAVDYIPEIIETAKNGNYMVALEALTVVENLEGPFSNEKLMEAQFILNEYFSEAIDEKENIMKSLFDVIVKFENTSY